MTAGISDPKQSQAGGLSKDLGGGVGWATRGGGGVRGLMGSCLFYEQSCLRSARTFNALINHF